MPHGEVRVYFRCSSCGALSPMLANLHEYDPAEMECERCAAGTWVELEDVLDKDGRRYVSRRPETQERLVDPEAPWESE